MSSRMHSSGQSDSIMQLHQLYQMHGDLKLNPGGVGWLPMIIFVKVYYFIAIIYNDFKHRTQNWNSTCRLICRCAKAAGKKGYEFFGIQHYGECWSSADAASRFHIYGPNDKCINNEFKSCDNLASDEACSGVNYANYVYEIFPRKYVCCCM